MVGILVYILIGLAVGALARFNKSETSSLAGNLGTGGAGGLAGGVAANLLFSDAIVLDVYGVIGSAILALVAVLVVGVAYRRNAAEAVTEAPPED
jgi:hypothetical protein